ncbi:MAG: SDR family oxidoreductase, partial [Pseudomonadota bacterium]
MTADLFSLEGKTALVTGGGTGIGKAIAQAFSDAGAYLILIGRRENLLREALEGRNGLPVSVDLFADGPLTTIKQACETHGTFPDIIVNAAGLNPRKHADEVTQEVWEQTIHLNLTIPILHISNCRLSRDAGGPAVYIGVRRDFFRAAPA